MFRVLIRKHGHWQISTFVLADKGLTSEVAQAVITHLVNDCGYIFKELAIDPIWAGDYRLENDMITLYLEDDDEDV